MTTLDTNLFAAPTEDLGPCLDVSNPDWDALRSALEPRDDVDAGLRRLHWLANRPLPARGRDSERRCSEALDALVATQRARYQDALR